MHAASAVRRLLLAALLLGALPASAQVPDILKRVDDHYNHLHSLRARFHEQFSGYNTTRAEAGTLLLSKPGRMAWHYDTPAGKVFVLDGKFAWSYTPGDPQASRMPAAKLDDLRTPLRFLLGHTRLGKELDSIEVKPVDGGFRIAGVPHGQSARFHSLQFVVTNEGAIRSIRIEEADGSLTAFQFDQLEENMPIRPADFVFVPPAGVAVVDALPPA